MGTNGQSMSLWEMAAPVLTGVSVFVGVVGLFGAIAAGVARRRREADQ